jgi:xylan 1,4-beta-xylosidase
MLKDFVEPTLPSTRDRLTREAQRSIFFDFKPQVQQRERYWLHLLLFVLTTGLHPFRAETELLFRPEHFQQAAGLTHYYNRHKFHFAAVTHDPKRGRVLRIMSCLGDWQNGKLTFMPDEPVPLAGDGPVGLAADVDGAKLQFYWRTDGDWTPLGPVLDASLISDEGGRGEHASFTGAFIGVAAFDTSGAAMPADFSYFEYQRRD